MSLPPSNKELPVPLFRKDLLVRQLLSMGHRKVTPQLADEIADKIEGDLKSRPIASLAADSIYSLIQQKLSEFNLVDASFELEGAPAGSAEPEGILHPEILEFLAPPAGEVFHPPPSTPLTKILPVFSEEALEQIRQRIVWRDEQGIPTEVPTQMLSRVAGTATHAERRYDPLADLRLLEVAFYNLLASGAFIPDLAVLRNAGKGGGTVTTPVTLKFRGGGDEMLSLLSLAERAHRDALPLSIFMEKRGSSGVSADRLAALLKIFLETRFLDPPSRVPGEFLLEAEHPDLGKILSALRSERAPFSFRKKILLSDSFMLAVEKDLPVGDRKGRDIFRELVYEIR